MGKEPVKGSYTITVCCGHTCLDGKSKKLRSRLKALVEEQGLKGRVKVKKGSCLKDCSRGPIVEIDPGGRRFEGVRPKAARRLLAELTAGSKKVK